MSTESRSLTKTIKALLKVVPDDEVGLRAELHKTYESACYCPPEGMGLWWRRAAGALSLATEKYMVASDKPGVSHPPTSGVPWVEACMRIFNGTDPAEWYLDLADAE